MFVCLFTHIFFQTVIYNLWYRNKFFFFLKEITAFISGYPARSPGASEEQIFRKECVNLKNLSFSILIAYDFT